VGAACFFMRKHGPLFCPRAANRARSLPAFSRKKRRLLRLVLYTRRPAIPALEPDWADIRATLLVEELVSLINILLYIPSVLRVEAAEGAGKAVEDRKEGDRRYIVALRAEVARCHCHWEGLAVLDHRLAALLRNIVDLLQVIIELAGEVGPPTGVAAEHPILWEVLDEPGKDGRVYVGGYSQGHVGAGTRVKTVVAVAVAGAGLPLSYAYPATRYTRLWRLLMDIPRRPSVQ
jgi:hypothetical protein